MNIRSVAMGLAPFVLAGCAVGPDYREPDVAPDAEWVPQDTALAVTPGADIDDRWWRVFDDDALNGYIDLAVRENHDVRIAEARVRQARALRGIAGAALLPQVDASADAVRFRLSENSPQAGSQLAGGGLIDQVDNLYQAGFDASWEIDVFGGNRRAVQSARAGEEAANERRRDVLLSVLAEVARNYTEIRGNQRRLAVTERNVELQEQTTELVEKKFRVGLSRELDVVRARAQTEATRALIPSLRAEIRAGAYRMAVLTGQPPGELLRELVDTDVELEAPDDVALGLRSEQLLRRPDVRAAERDLAQATADVGVAVADLYPRFFAVGSGGWESGQTDNLFGDGSKTWQIGPAIRWPVFQGGRIRANIRLQNAEADEAAARFEQTVLRALEDVEASLVRYGEERYTFESLQDATDASTRAVELASKLYEKGLSDFLTVLDAERRLVEIEDQKVQSETRVLVRLVALYKSLGGGWESFE